jgi:hypothetical protein
MIARWCHIRSVVTPPTEPRFSVRSPCQTRGDGVLRCDPARLSQQFNIPIQPVPPAIVQEIGRKGAAVILKLPACRADRGDVEAHLGFLRRPPAFAQVARCAGGRDIFPGRAAAIGARDNMIEGQIIADATILALETIPQEHVEPRERWMLRRLYILLERNHRRQFHGMRRRMDLALIMVDNIDAVEEHGFYRRLPRPDTEWIIAERRIISIEHKRRASVGMADKVGVIHAVPKSLSCPRGPWGQLVTGA